MRPELSISCCADPIGVAAKLIAHNEDAVRRVNASLRSQHGDSSLGVLSFSHFLPCRQALPDWMEPYAESSRLSNGGSVPPLSRTCAPSARSLTHPAYGTLSLHRDVEHFDPKWINHAAAGKAVKFSKVAGSDLLDKQLRKITEGAACSHQLHAFGHSHRPKDFMRDGVRYIHHPVAYAEERNRRRVSPLPCLKLVWGNDGPQPAPTVLRYWEEYGGTVD